MSDGGVIVFGPFRLDLADERLFRGTEPVELGAKAFAVLRHLVGAPGRLIKKDELLDAVWPDVHVTEGVLKVAISEIRRELDDEAGEPRYVETVHRRGYRFVAPVREEPRAGAPLRSASPQREGAVVGRTVDVEALELRLRQAAAGERQILFVTGEAGIGKTTLVDLFLGRARSLPGVRVARGLCLDTYGAGEPYLAVLEAVARLGAEPDVVKLLADRAPSWLAQIPWLVSEREQADLALRGASRERMLREMAEAIEALAADRPLVLVLEDLHWSDPSTVDLIGFLARRPEPARFLLVGTYRPADAIFEEHPIRALHQDLATQAAFAELALEFLTLKDVAEYVQRRFAESELATSLAPVLHARTDGNPLFLAILADELVRRGHVRREGERWRLTADPTAAVADVPESLRQMIERQLDRLGEDDRRLLEAASLGGVEFATSSIAAALERDLEELEERCARLARDTGLLRNAGERRSADGSPVTFHRFGHSLYPSVFASRVPAARRVRLNRRIAEHEEAAFGGAEAARLALLFEGAGEIRRALAYRRQAAETAARRFASREAETHLERGLGLLEALPAGPERDAEELLLQSQLGPMRITTRGYAAPEVEQAYSRALELAGRTGASPPFPVLFGLWSFALVRADYDRAREFAERCRVIAEAEGDRGLLIEAHQALWTTWFYLGDFLKAEEHLVAGEKLYDPVAHRGHALVYGQDPLVAALSLHSLFVWADGEPDRARAMSRAAVEHARALGHPMSIGMSLVFAAWLRYCFAEPEACRAEAEAIMALAMEHEFPHWMASGLVFHGWALAELGDADAGIAEIEQGISIWSAIGANMGRTSFLDTLARAKMRAARHAEALEHVEQALSLVESTGERYDEGELHRLRGELLSLADGDADEAERSFRRARDVAKRQHIVADELRAAMSLVRHAGSAAKRKRARDELAGILRRCNGTRADIPEARQARELLAR